MNGAGTGKEKSESFLARGRENGELWVQGRRKRRLVLCA